MLLIILKLRNHWIRLVIGEITERFSWWLPEMPLFSSCTTLRMARGKDARTLEKRYNRKNAASHPPLKTTTFAGS